MEGGRAVIGAHVMCSHLYLLPDPLSEHGVVKLQMGEQASV